MQRTKPPFRADHVGSLLRSVALKEARGKRERGEITAEQLKVIEDREIEVLIRKQEAAGLKSITDGEYRRMFWHYDFYDGLDNVEIYELPGGIQFQGVQTKPKGVRVTGKIDFSSHPMLEHFRFVKQHAKVMPKMCIPAPTVLHFRLEPGARRGRTQRRFHRLRPGCRRRAGHLHVDLDGRSDQLQRVDLRGREPTCQRRVRHARVRLTRPGHGHADPHAA